MVDREEITRSPCSQGLYRYKANAPKSSLLPAIGGHQK
jgi:hypothetical protein